MNPLKILVVEDEGIVALEITESLEKLGYEVVGTADNFSETLDAITAKQPDLILMDVVLSGDKDGVEIARYVRQHFQIPVIFLTAYADPDTVQRGNATDPVGYLVKPIQEEDLYAAIETAQRIHSTLAQRQTQAQQETEQVNRSLNQDFRASLRTMQGFSNAIIEDYGNELDPTAQDYIERVQRAAAKMDEVVQALVTYNHLSTQDIALQSLSLEAVLDKLLLSLQPQIEATQAQIEVQHPLPKVRCDRGLLRLILTELLHNALTYIRPDTPPQIHIFTETQGDTVRLNIQDQGTGIAPEAQKRIFDLFERSRRSEQFPGRGVGLGIVSKAVERLGTSCGVHSQPQQGSTFWVELPLGD